MIYMRQSTQVTNQGIGFLGLTFLVLLVLKLAVGVPISWWLVTLPLWIAPAALVAAAIFAGLVWLLSVAWKTQAEKGRRKRRMQMGS